MIDPLLTRELLDELDDDVASAANWGEVIVDVAVLRALVKCAREALQMRAYALEQKAAIDALNDGLRKRKGGGEHE